MQEANTENFDLEFVTTATTIAARGISADGTSASQNDFRARNDNKL